MKYIGVPCMCERVSYNKERLLINMVLETISYISVCWHDARDRFRSRSQCTALSCVENTFVAPSLQREQRLFYLRVEYEIISA